MDFFQQLLLHFDVQARIDLSGFNVRMAEYSFL